MHFIVDTEALVTMKHTHTHKKSLLKAKQIIRQILAMTDIPAGFRSPRILVIAETILQFPVWPLGVSLSLRMAEALSLSPSGAPLLCIIYTPSFENGSFLKIHLDYQTLKVTSPELSVWLGGWLQTAEQCSRLDINAWLGCAGRREEPALCSLLQPIIFYVCLFSQQQERI